MFYAYVLRSRKDCKFYVGYTKDLTKRFEQHRNGKVEPTKNRRPLDLVYYEASICKADAVRREQYLKTAYGKRYLNSRLKDYLEKEQHKA